MRALFSLLLFLSWAFCLRAQLSPEWDLFQDFIERYNKSYRNDSNLSKTRFLAFKESLQRHQWLNSYEAENGGSAVYGVNKFSDLTPREFGERYLSGLKRSNITTNHYHLPTPPHVLHASLNKTFDWRTKGVVGQIWNQEQCGSCWAFATVETIASRYAIEYGHLVELSAEQLISCDVEIPGLDGCRGGALFEAFSTVQNKSIIIVRESSYPFKSGDRNTHTCKTDLPKEGVRLLKFTYSSMVNESDMLMWLVTYSPLTVSVNAHAWQDYDGGIIQHHCSGYGVDHAVQVVGYDLNGPVPYWIVRNTWGSDWGEDGYLRLKFGQNMCGLTDEVVYVENVVGVGL